LSDQKNGVQFVTATFDIDRDRISPRIQQKISVAGRVPEKPCHVSKLTATHAIFAKQRVMFFEFACGAVNLSKVMPNGGVQ
jgi:hypothetical protein